MSQTLEGLTARIASLRSQLTTVEAQAHSLRRQLLAAEADLARSTTTTTQPSQAHEDAVPSVPPTSIGLSDSDVTGKQQQQQQQQQQPNLPPQRSAGTGPWPLTDAEYRRYGRQLILREVGLGGQLKLRGARVLVVGLGGLGCPAAAYLAGAGVGALGLVDGDTVEESNLHRQVAHASGRVGWGKAGSAEEFLRGLNPLVECRCYPFHLGAGTALDVVEGYDLVLDCTDHPTSRYLISDACVMAGKPLVSASALRTDGQLIVLNNPPRPPGDAAGGPCYRCIFPRPPPADSVLSCGEGGILGPVVGTMGVLQALEAIKILIATPDAGPARDGDVVASPPRASMLMFSAYSTPPFRQVRMRARHVSCATCSANPSVTRQSLTSGSLDYVAFCGGPSQPVELLSPGLRTSATDFARLPQDGSNVLIDVRDSTQFGICALRGSRNVPWTGNAETWLRHARSLGAIPSYDTDCYVVCRFGNDSQLAVGALLSQMSEPDRSKARIKDVRGGFQAWRQEVDPSWPEY